MQFRQGRLRHVGMRRALGRVAERLVMWNQPRKQVVLMLGVGRMWQGQTVSSSSSSFGLI